MHARQQRFFIPRRKVSGFRKTTAAAQSTCPFVQGTVAVAQTPSTFEGHTSLDLMHDQGVGVDVEFRRRTDNCICVTCTDSIWGCFVLTAA